jgi:hypothetical protein
MDKNFLFGDAAFVSSETVKTDSLSTSVYYAVISQIMSISFLQCSDICPGIFRCICKIVKSTH